MTAEDVFAEMARPSKQSDPLVSEYLRVNTRRRANGNQGTRITPRGERRGQKARERATRESDSPTTD